MEDKLLVYRCKRGSEESLRRIYEKYKEDLLITAASLLFDRSQAQDVVHDVFVSFVDNLATFTLRTNLKGYLATCVANCARNCNLSAARKASVPARSENAYDPAEQIIFDEQAQQIADAMAQLPHEQREAILLHIRGGMAMREIAHSLGVSVNTVKSRYRYGCDKLRLILKNEVQK